MTLRAMTRMLLWGLAALLSLSAGAKARAAVPLCLKIETEARHQAGLRKLVVDQLAHHKTHRLAEEGCQGTLQVQLFHLAGVRYLTVRIDDQVPVRFTVTAKNQGERLARALARVLLHEPVYLAEDIQRYSGMQRAMHSMLQAGHNIWRLELMEAITSSGSGAAFASVLAFAATRGSGHYRIFARLYFGGSVGGTAAEDQKLRVLAGGDLGLTYEFLERALTSPYISAGLGVQLLHYEGRLSPEEAAPGSATAKGGTLSLRLGVRFFRATDFDLDLFALGYLPMFKTFDPDSELIDHYTPSVQLGIGVGF